MITIIPTHNPPQILNIKTISEIKKENSYLFFGLILSLIFYIGTEAGLSVWIPTYLLDKFRNKETIFRISLVLTFFWIGLSLGRYICSYLSNRIKPIYILLTIIFFSIISILLGIWYNYQFLSELFFAITGLFLSGIYPILMSYTKNFSEKYSSVVFSILISAGSFGGILFPYLVGLTSEFSTFSLGMTIIIIPLIILIFICSMLKYKRYI
jgi:fucose permease